MQNEYESCLLATSELENIMGTIPVFAEIKLTADLIKYICNYRLSNYLQLESISNSIKYLINKYFSADPFAQQLKVLITRSTSLIYRNKDIRILLSEIKFDPLSDGTFYDVFDLLKFWQNLK